MIHPAWQSFIPKLRKLLDDQGLSHIAIKERSDGAPLSLEDLLEIYETPNISFDEFLVFEPVDPDWRIYRVEGAPFEDWIGRAHITEFHAHGQRKVLFR